MLIAGVRKIQLTLMLLLQDNPAVIIIKRVKNISMKIELSILALSTSQYLPIFRKTKGKTKIL
jgi:hypothetical protein